MKSKTPSGKSGTHKIVSLPQKTMTKKIREATVVNNKPFVEELRKSREKYRTILDNIEDGYYETDLAGNLTFFNDSLCRISGVSRQKLIGINHRAYTSAATAKELFVRYPSLPKFSPSPPGFPPWK